MLMNAHEPFDPKPPALATVVLYSGGVQGLITTGSHGFLVCYGALVRGMNYSQTHRLLLWASLASQQPRRLAGGGVEYSMPLPRPALIDERFPPTTGGSRLSHGHYLGRISMRLSNIAWAPVYSDLQAITMCCRDKDRDLPCHMTIALEELRPATPPQDAPTIDPLDPDPFTLNSLARMYHWLSRLLEA